MSKSKKSKTVRKEVKKEIKAIKKATRHAPKGRKSLHKELRVVPKTVHGKGGYFGDIGSKIGGVMDVGAGIVKTITGLGEYKVKGNSLIESGAPPQVRNTKYSTTITGHPEYICDIVSSTGFKIQKFPVNPGVSGTFPWLAPQATGYEQYKCKGVLFQFRSTCGDAISSTDNAMGTVIMASEYNVNLPDFTDKQQMEDHEYTTSIKPSETALHPVECARSKSVLDDLYVRNGSETVPDLKFYDLCNFYIATQGQQAAGVTIGELWVTYEFEFLKPALAVRTTNNVAEHWYWDSDLGVAPDGIFSVANLREKNTGQTTSSIATRLPTLQGGRYFLLLSIGTSDNTYTGNGYTFNVDGPSGTSTFTFDGLATNPATGVSGNGLFNDVGTTVTTLGRFIESTGPWWITDVDGIVSGATVTTWDLWILPFGAGIGSKARRAVEYDPLVVMNNKLNLLMDRLGRSEARAKALLERSANRPCSVNFDDEKSDSYTPCNSPVVVDEPYPEELSRSQASLATLLLDKLVARPPITSKTGFVRAA